jgi:MoxR-like ATPase
MTIATTNYRSFLPWQNDLSTALAEGAGDDRSGLVYLHDPALQLVAETAIVTRRPLLIRGEPGTGKSSFAPFAARNLNWRYYEKAVTGRMEARDLLWSFDALERLRDAQSRGNVSPARYVKPGVLWWAFNRADALQFLAERSLLRKSPSATAPVPLTSDVEEPFAQSNLSRDPDRAVVLIDEIDKADPEVPNDLLEVLGLNRFYVDELPRTVQRNAPVPDVNPLAANHFGGLLIVITTNEERDLPPAFLRRCVVHTLQEPAKPEEQSKRLQDIAGMHMAKLIASRPQGSETVTAVANKFCEIRDRPHAAGRRRAGTAEFLDAVRVCLHLDITPTSDVWKQIEANVIIK